MEKASQSKTWYKEKDKTGTAEVGQQEGCALVVRKAKEETGDTERGKRK